MFEYGRHQATRTLLEGVTVEHVDVVIVGAGPVGAMLAIELRLRGVEVLVLERLAEPTGQSRASALHARTVATLRRRGLLEPLAEIARLDGAGFSPPRGRAQFAGMAVLDRSVLPADGPALLGVTQARVESVLSGHAERLGARILRGCNVTDLSMMDDRVEVAIGEQRVAAQYVVGCDGGRSTVRAAAGIGFPGTPSTVAGLLGDVTLAEPGSVPFGWHGTPRGWTVGMFRPNGTGRLLVFEFAGAHRHRDAPVTEAELGAAAQRVLGRPVAFAASTWLSRFGDACRQADAYRRGRVLLAGDAAHVHFPVGGQGLNLGLQDAVNLGWKLAGAVHGWAAPDLLDSYQAERAPIAATVLRNARAQSVLMDPDPRFDPLRGLFRELAELPEVNRHLVGQVGGVDIRYGPVGTFADDLRIETGDGPRQLADLLADGRAYLLNLTGATLPSALGIALLGCPDRVGLVTGRSVTGPAALLVRPDGYLAWAAAENAENPWSGAGEALRDWFGVDLEPNFTVTQSDEPVTRVGG
jgi:2-polyprenyl-6-methoxyphenol hydroxylase-like FAD-dependent oxidoreductase